VGKPMEKIRSIGELRKTVKRLSATMECGECRTLELGSVDLLTKAPAVVMEVNLSLIDIWEEEGSVMMKVENRFGKKCVEGKK